MSRNFKKRIVEHLIACLLLVLAAALFAGWIMVIFFENNSLPVETGIFAGVLVFLAIIAYPVCGRLIKSKFAKAVYRSAKFIVWRAKSRKITEARYRAYQYRKRKAMRKPYFETRF